MTPKPYEKYTAILDVLGPEPNTAWDTLDLGTEPFDPDIEDPSDGPDKYIATCRRQAVLRFNRKTRKREPAITSCGYPRCRFCGWRKNRETLGKFWDDIRHWDHVEVGIMSGWEKATKKAFEQRRTRHTGPVRLVYAAITRPEDVGDFPPSTTELLRGELHYIRMWTFSNVPIGGRGWVSISVRPYTALVLAAHALRHPLPTYAWSSSRFPGREVDERTGEYKSEAWITHDKPPPDPNYMSLTSPHSFKDLGELDGRLTTAISEFTGLAPSELVPEGMTEDQLVQLVSKEVSKMEQARNKEHDG